jgi:hypothetical protein
LNCRDRPQAVDDPLTGHRVPFAPTHPIATTATIATITSVTRITHAVPHEERRRRHAAGGVDGTGEPRLRHDDLLRCCGRGRRPAAQAQVLVRDSRRSHTRLREDRRDDGGDSRDHVHVAAAVHVGGAAPNEDLEQHQLGARRGSDMDEVNRPLRARGPERALVPPRQSARRVVRIVAAKAEAEAQPYPQARRRRSSGSRRGAGPAHSKARGGDDAVLEAAQDPRVVRRVEAEAVGRDDEAATGGRAGHAVGSWSPERRQKDSTKRVAKYTLPEMATH